MKTIQGRVLFGVIPIYADKRNKNDIFSDLMGVRHKIVDYFKLSTITEQQASGLVEWWDLSDDYSPHVFKGAFPDYLGDMEYDVKSTAKDSLVSLLEANDCWVKEWGINTKEFLSKPENKGVGLYTLYNNTPDDWLVFMLNK